MQQIWIDVSKGLDVAMGRPSSSVEEVRAEVDAALMSSMTAPAPRPSHLRTDEIRHAVKLCSSSKEAVIDMFADVRMGRALDIERLDSLIEQITDSVVQHPDALISLARLKTADEYTYMHSVAVCALMIAFARQLGLDEDTVHCAGLGGLLHDIGKVSISRKLLSKPGKLSVQEYATMRAHPVMGAVILQNGMRVCPQVWDVTLHHHERFDGSGYPDGLAGEEISLLSRMAAICDVYDALTSDRVYKEGWDPAVAIRKMAEWKRQFDTQLFHAFVKTIGIYPVGSLVRLKSGLIGVVTEQSSSSLLTPKVKAFFCAETRAAVEHRIIDLGREQENDRIEALEPAGRWGFSKLNELWIE